MKLQFELTLVVHSESKTVNSRGDTIWDTQSIDTIMGNNLTELLGQFQLVLASVHHRIVNDTGAIATPVLLIHASAPPNELQGE